MIAVPANIGGDFFVMEARDEEEEEEEKGDEEGDDGERGDGCDGAAVIQQHTERRMRRGMWGEGNGGRRMAGKLKRVPQQAGHPNEKNDYIGDAYL